MLKSPPATTRTQGPPTDHDAVIRLRADRLRRKHGGDAAAADEARDILARDAVRAAQKASVDPNQPLSWAVETTAYLELRDATADVLALLTGDEPASRAERIQANARHLIDRYLIADETTFAERFKGFCRVADSAEIVIANRLTLAESRLNQALESLNDESPGVAGKPQPSPIAFNAASDVRLQVDRLVAARTLAGGVVGAIAGQLSLTLLPILSGIPVEALEMARLSRITLDQVDDDPATTPEMAPLSRPQFVPVNSPRGGSSANPAIDARQRVSGILARELADARAKVSGIPATSPELTQLRTALVVPLERLASDLRSGDAELVRLASAIIDARQRVNEIEALASREGQNASGVRSEILNPLNEAIEARRDQVGRYVNENRMLDAARSGNIEAIAAVYRVITDQPAMFSSGLAERIRRAAAEAIIVAGWPELVSALAGVWYTR
jgi:hypothetical protein